MRERLAMRFAQIVHDEFCDCGKPHRTHGDTYLTVGRALRREVQPELPPVNPLLSISLDPDVPPRPLA